MLGKILRTLFTLLFTALALSILLVLLLRWVNPPFTALMLERQLSEENYSSQRTWVPWQSLPNNLKMAVIAAEDQQFSEHYGFDLAAKIGRAHV